MKQHTVGDGSHHETVNVENAILGAINCVVDI